MSDSDSSFEEPDHLIMMECLKKFNKRTNYKYMRPYNLEDRKSVVSNLMSSQRNNLKQAIIQILSCALQPDSEIQRLTEERKKALEMTEDYPFILLEIIVGDEALSERTMAASFLKNYVLGIRKGERKRVGLGENWELKICLKALDILGCQETAIRDFICQTLCILIQEYNYHNYQLIALINNKVMTYLLSEDIGQIEGGIKLMNELFFCHRMDPKFSYFSPEHIEPLLKIINNENYPITLRGDTVVCMIESWENCRNDKITFNNIGNRLTKCFVTLLEKEYHPINNNFRFKGDLIFGIIVSLLRLNDDSYEFVKHCLLPVGQIFFGACQIVKDVLMGIKPIPKDCNEDDEMHFSRLMMYVLELIQNVLHVESLTSCFQPCLNEFVYNLFLLMCSVDDDVEALFGEDNMDDSIKEYKCPRMEACSILLDFKEKIPSSVFTTLVHNAIQKHLTEANILRENHNLYFLRMFESLMYGLGAIHNEKPVTSFLVYVEEWSNMLRDHNSLNWFILSRLIWLGSKCSIKLSRESLNLHITAILSHCHSTTESCRIACMGSMKNHLKQISNNPNKDVILNFLTEIATYVFEINYSKASYAFQGLEIMRYLFDFVPQARTDEYTRNALAQMSYVLQEHLPNYSLGRNVEIVLGILTKYCNQNLVLDFISNIFSLIDRTLPHLQPRVEITEVGLYLLNIIVMYWNGDVPESLILTSFETAYNHYVMFNDISNMTAGLTLLTNLIMKAPNKFDSIIYKGKTLLRIVNDIVLRLLDSPYGHDHHPRNFGRFIVICIMCFSDHFIPQMETILKGLITFLQRSSRARTLTDCYLIFAYVFTWQTENLMNFLCSIPGPDGKSALNFFLDKWTKDHLPFNPFDLRIMTVGICKMIEYCLRKPDSRIRECRCVMVEVYYGGALCTGLEKLYFLLTKVFINEAACSKTDYSDYYFDDELAKSHPFYGINLVEHIKEFLKNYYDICYYNSYDNFIKHYDSYQSVLGKHGIMPVVEGGIHFRLAYDDETSSNDNNEEENLN